MPELVHQIIICYMPKVCFEEINTLYFIHNEINGFVAQFFAGFVAGNK